MRKKIQVPMPETKFRKSPEAEVEGFSIIKGDFIKIRGEYGLRFKFDSLTKNIDSGAEWVDCFEMHKGQVGAFRSFRIERIKRIPKKRVKKSVN